MSEGLNTTKRRFRPWARVAAKAVDLTIFMVLLRAMWPPVADHALKAFLVVACLYPALEAALIALIGTTPGKALMHISIRTRDGERLPLRVAVNRSYGAHFFGAAAGLSPNTPINSYHQYQQDGVTPWDRAVGAAVSATPKWWSWIAAGTVLLAFNWVDRLIAWYDLYAAG